MAEVKDNDGCRFQDSRNLIKSKRMRWKNCSHQQLKTNLFGHVIELDSKDNSPVTVLNDSIYCDSSGKYIYQFQILNNSGYDIDQIIFSNVSPAGVIVDPVSAVVADGSTSGILTTCIGGPGAPRMPRLPITKL